MLIFDKFTFDKKNDFSKAKKKIVNKKKLLKNDR